jgi:hypothetical protein
VGDVFWADTWIFLDNDDKGQRPVVVVRAPQHREDIVTVIERSASRFDLRGVEHPSDATLDLNKRGKWILRYTRMPSAAIFCEPNVRAVGRLGSEYLNALIQMWEDW